MTKWRCSCGEIIRQNRNSYSDGQGSRITHPNASCTQGHGHDGVELIEA